MHHLSIWSFLTSTHSKPSGASPGGLCVGTFQSFLGSFMSTLARACKNPIAAMVHSTQNVNSLISRTSAPLRRQQANSLRPLPCIGPLWVTSRSLAAPRRVRGGGTLAYLVAVAFAAVLAVICIGPMVAHDLAASLSGVGQ